jgi:hypothetical protein
MPLSSAYDKSAPPGTMPLSSASDKSEPCLYPLHLINLSPFVINGKGIFPSRAAPPDRLSSYGASSCTSKTYKISIQKAFIFGVEITPSLWQDIQRLPMEVVL